MTAKFLMTTIAAAILFGSCDVTYPIYDTAHPGQGSITLTTEWSERGDGIDIPASYTVRVGDYSATVSGATNTIDNLFDPGSYTAYVYNAADNITVSGATATAVYTAGSLGWQFTSALTATIAADADHEFTATMAQQVRELMLVIAPTGSTADKVEGITATLSGAAGTLEFDNDAHGAPSSVALTFSRITSGDDAGKWTATVRLLGVAGAEQKLTGTITFADGSPADTPLESDLTSALAGFNADKKTPLTLGGAVVEIPEEAGFTATINDWNPVSGGNVIAN